MFFNLVVQFHFSLNNILENLKPPALAVRGGQEV